MRDWYVESFKDLREFPAVKDMDDEKKFTDLLRHIYHRHRHVVPVMAMGVAELKRELQEGVGLLELPEIHQFLDGFYLSRIGIRILIGQHIALHEPEQENYIGETLLDIVSTRSLMHNIAVADCSSAYHQLKLFSFQLSCVQLFCSMTCGLECHSKRCKNAMLLVVQTLQPIVYGEACSQCLLICRYLEPVCDCFLQ